MTDTASPSPLIRLRPWHKHTLAALVLLFLWSLFFWKILTPTAADRMVFAQGDFTVQFFAASDYQVQRINNGVLVPEWNPYNYGGEPFAANLQVAAWYPPRWLAAILLGDANGWQIEDYQLEIAVHYLFISLTMYAFLMLRVRRILPALFGAVMFTYGGFLTSYPMLQAAILECAAWLPLMLTGIHLSLTRPRWVVGGMVLAGIAAAVSFFGTHPQTTMQIVYLSAVYLLFMAWEMRLSWRDIVWRLMLYGVVALGLSMAQLWPAAEFTTHSYRLDQYAYADKSNGYTVAELLNIIWPRLEGMAGLESAWSPLYMGTIGLLLAVGALLRRTSTRETRFWGLVGLAGLLLALGHNSVAYDFFYLFVPGVSLFRLQEHMALIFALSITMLAVFQLDWLLYPPEMADPSETRSFRWWVVAFIAFNLIYFLLSAVFDLPAVNAVLFVLLMAGIFAYWLWSGERHPLAASLLLVVLVVDLFTVGMHQGNWLPDMPDNRPAVPAELELLRVPQPRDIQWRVDGGVGLSGYGVYWRIPDIYGNGPIFINSIEQLRRIPVHRFWEVLSVRYITVADAIPPQSAGNLTLLAYGRNAGGEEYELLEVDNPRPIAHLVYDSITAEGSAEFARQFMADPRVDLRETAILLHPLPFTLSGQRPELSEVLDFRMETPEHIMMNVSTGEDVLLTVSIPNYPGWSAAVNGEPVEIVDTYAGLIGVPVREGIMQEVTLTYASDTVRAGVIISLVTLVVALAGSVLWAFSRFKRA